MSTLSIGPGLAIENASDLHAQLLKPARSKNPVTLAAAQIDRLHSAAIQVLCAFVRDRAEAKGTTHIDAPEELRNAAALLGVAQLLGLDTPTRTTP